MSLVFLNNFHPSNFFLLAGAGFHIEARLTHMNQKNLSFLVCWILLLAHAERRESKSVVCVEKHPANWQFFSPGAKLAVGIIAPQQKISTAGW